MRPALNRAKRKVEPASDIAKPHSVQPRDSYATVSRAEPGVDLAAQKPTQIP
jgi:hypothetical protein